MLSHLCQARLWTRSERKAITGAITTDTSNQLKTWPVLNNAIGEICHPEVINGKRTRTDCFLYSKDNMSSVVSVPFHSSSWNLKENNGGTEENSQAFSINSSYSQVSENPAYGLTPAWTESMQGRYISDSSSSETRNTLEEEEYHIYGGIGENENDVSKEAKELHQKHRLELDHKYSLNSNKIEHIKHYLKTSSANHFDVKSKFCSMDETVMVNCEELTPKHKEIRHKSSLTSKEKARQGSFEDNKTDGNSAITPNVHSLKDICNHQGFRTTNSAGRKPIPQLDKLHCGSTFLSQANRTQNKIYELPPQSNNLPTEHVSEQMPLWTESYLPSNNQNHRYNTYLNNDWYQLSLPKYQKLPLQKTSTPSPIPSQKISQNVEEILKKSSKRNPANISMVIMQSTCLRSDPKENSSEKDIALPMGSLVAALYKESDWLYVQTPHGEKGFVTFSNCMALGTLTDDFFALTNVIDHFNEAQDSESSGEESDSEQLVSMEPLRETNYSKLAEVKANCGGNHQKNNMEEIFSMITKHGLGHVNFSSEKVCDNKESKPSDCNGFQLTSQGKSEERNISCRNIKDTCNMTKGNKFVIYKNCFEDVDKSRIWCESVNDLQDLHADDLGLPENVTNRQNKINTDFDLTKNGNIDFLKRKMDKLNILDESGKVLTEECLQETGGSNSLRAYIDQNKTIKETEITSSIFGEDNKNVIPFDKRPDETNRNTNIDDEQKCETPSFSTHSTNANDNYTKKLIQLKERENGSERDDALKNCIGKETNLLKNKMECSSKCKKEILGKVENVSGSKNDLNKCKVLAIIENYSSEEEGTLSVRKGDLVTLLDVANSEWMWVSTANGTEGYVPSVCTSQVGIF